jgi:hypothetical protein
MGFSSRLKLRGGDGAASAAPSATPAAPSKAPSTPATCPAQPSQGQAAQTPPSSVPSKTPSKYRTSPTAAAVPDSSHARAIFASENVHLYKAFDDSFKLVDESMFHWFILNRHTDEIIDITASQYSSYPKLLKKLYKNKRKASPLGFGYKIRVQILLQKVKSDLNLL